MLELEPARVDLVRGERPEHECVVGIRAVSKPDQHDGEANRLDPDEQIALSRALPRPGRAAAPRRSARRPIRASQATPYTCCGGRSGAHRLDPGLPEGDLQAPGG